MAFTLTTEHYTFRCLSSLYLICYGILFQKPEGMKLLCVLQLSLLPVSFMPHAHFGSNTPFTFTLGLAEFAHGCDLATKLLECTHYNFMVQASKHYTHIRTMNFYQCGAHSGLPHKSTFMLVLPQALDTIMSSKAKAVQNTSSVSTLGCGLNSIKYFMKYCSSYLAHQYTNQSQFSKDSR